jgi:hypothetical protein
VPPEGELDQAAEVDGHVGGELLDLLEVQQRALVTARLPGPSDAARVARQSVVGDRGGEDRAQDGVGLASGRRAGGGRRLRVPSPNDRRRDAVQWQIPEARQDPTVE